MSDNSKFEIVWFDALRNANNAAVAQNAKLGDEKFRGLDCGFAWLQFPGNTPFARWAKKQPNLTSKGYPTGLTIWYSKLHRVSTQSVSVHEAAAKAACDTFKALLPEAKVTWSSRLD